MTTKGACRHYGTWIMAGGYVEWCYCCGAIRKLTKIYEKNGTETGGSVPGTTWVRPTGSKKNNPYSKMRMRP